MRSPLSSQPLRTSATQVSDWPESPGVYVVWGPEESDRPLYVGKANNLRRRWARQHLRNRSNTSALRRSLGVHLGLVATKLKKPERAYPEQVEERVTAFLGDCALDLRPTATPEDALRLEHDLIASLDPRLNVQRKRRAAPSLPQEAETDL